MWQRNYCLQQAQLKQNLKFLTEQEKNYITRKIDVSLGEFYAARTWKTKEKQPPTAVRSQQSPDIMLKSTAWLK
jgi:hypothetical protein